jgi:unsaturated chondroitin disaccharide hydrolase
VAGWAPAVVAVALVASGCRSSRLNAERGGRLPPELAAALELAKARVGRLVDRIDDDPLAPTAYPSVTSGGDYQLVGSDDWEAGFYPMTLWLLYELTGAARWKKSAEVRTLGLWDAAVEPGGDRDLGYRMMAFAEGWRLTGDPAYQRFLGRSAQSLAQTFNAGGACVGAFRSTLHGPARERANARYPGLSYPVLITSLVTLESLFAAADQLDDQKEWYRELAHALRVADDFVRPDGSTYGLVDYPTDCPARGYRTRGSPMASPPREPGGGEGTWARGQAFALHGLGVAFAHTRDPRLLRAARKVADFFLRAPTLPEDGVPCWDFAFGPTAGEPRDTSAAANAAPGLLALGALPELDPPSRERYADAGRRLLQALAARYLARDQPEGILAGATADGPTGGSGVSMIAGDYFFLDGIRRLLPGRSGIVCADRRCELEAESARPSAVELVVQPDGGTSIRWEPSGRVARDPLRAVYQFTLPEPGAVTVNVRLVAPAGSSGAVALAIDAEPDRAAAWTIPVTRQLEERAVAGPDGRPQVFRLKAGPHRLQLTSADRGVTFDKLVLEQVR